MRPRARRGLISGQCTFCRIVRNEAPRSVVFENATVLSFMDIHPVNPGHLLVVPKEHATHLADLPEETGADLMRAGMRHAGALCRGELAPDGINLFLADGEAAGQEIFHVHLHVLPRFRHDGFHLRIDYDPRPSRVELDRHAEIIRSRLGPGGTSA